MQFFLFLGEATINVMLFLAMILSTIHLSEASNSVSIVYAFNELPPLFFCDSYNTNNSFRQLPVPFEYFDLSI